MSNKIPKKRIDSILALQRQNDIIAMLLDGKDVNKEIIPWIANRYNATVGTCGIYIREAKNIIKQRKQFEVDNVVSLHIHRYEELFKSLHEIGADSIAMKALRQKEKLMGFHKEGFHMKVSSGEISSVHLLNVDSDYNVKKLSAEKQDQLMLLLNKAKRDGQGKNIQITRGSNKGV